VVVWSALNLVLKDSLLLTNGPSVFLGNQYGVIFFISTAFLVFKVILSNGNQGFLWQKKPSIQHEIEKIDLCDGGTTCLMVKNRWTYAMECAQILSPFLLRRVKTDVDLQIPPKKELLVYCPMSPFQQELYRATVDKTIADLVGANVSFLSHHSINEMKKKYQKVHELISVPCFEIR